MAARSKHKKARRPNQASAAALSEQFHGRPVEQVTAVAETVTERRELAELGRLVELVVARDGKAWSLKFENSDVRLASTPEGTQLYLVGGDQQVDLAALGLRPDRDHIVLGELLAVVYHTSKAFHDFEPTDYEHRFGEDSGIRPLLCYDVLNRALYIVGGNYRVRPEGIVD